MNTDNKKLLFTLLMLFGLVVSIRIAWPLFQSGFLKFQGNTTVNDAVYWIGVCSVLLLVILIGAIRVDDKPAPSNFPIHDRKLVKLSMICASGLLIATGIFNIWANPWDLYASDIWEPRVLPSRTVKLDFYSQLPEAPEMVILGTSAAFRLAPAYIQEKLGIQAFNWSINGGKAPEILILLDYLAQQHPGEYPKVLVMEINESPPRQGYTLLPYSLLPFLDFWPFIQEIGLRASKAINVSQLSDALYVFRYTLSPYTRSFTNLFFLEDGYCDRINKDFSEAAVLQQVKLIAKCSSAAEVFGEDIENIIALTEEQNSSIIFYISPSLPSFYDSYMKNNQDYQRCHQMITAYFTELTLQHDNVFFKDYTLLDSINGLDGPEGFYDSMHLTQKNGERLVDALADTIQQAYTIAEAQRNTTTGGVK